VGWNKKGRERYLLHFTFEGVVREYGNGVQGTTTFCFVTCLSTTKGLAFPIFAVANVDLP
jgi:hypothetical protein